MTGPTEWRFQWPDGTWIRWNPETESWEREASETLDETPDAGPPPKDLDAEGPPPIRRRRVPAPTEPPALAEPPPEVAAREPGPSPARAPTTEVIGVSDRARTRLWPSILVGSSLGLAAGVVVSVLIR